MTPTAAPPNKAALPPAAAIGVKPAASPTRGGIRPNLPPAGINPSLTPPAGGIKPAPPAPVGVRPAAPSNLSPKPHAVVPAARPNGLSLGAPTPAVGPRKETARIGALPDSPMKATVKLSPLQPTSTPPAGVIRTAPAAPVVANQPATGLVESVPLTFCWALLGISAVTFLIQLWTYFS
ncbi:MAG TPA: hypothetical protein VGF73_02880 [Chthoniobacterales bacterium]